MALTLAQANALLNNVTTVDDLRNLISQLDVTGQGTTTVLYSGKLVGNIETRGAAIKKLFG